MDEHQNVDVAGHSAALAEMHSRITALEELKVGYTDSTRRLTELERNVDVIAERTKHYEDNFDRLNKGFELLGEKIDNIKERVPSRDEWAALKGSVSAPEREAAASWKRVKDIIISVVLTGGIMFVLTRVLDMVGKK